MFDHRLPRFGQWARLFAAGRVLLRCICLLTLMAATLVAHRADARDAPAGEGDPSPISFDLPVQALGRALAAFSELTGYSVLVSSVLTAGRQGAAVRGDFEPRDALRRLVEGSGLVIRYVGARAFTLVPESAGAALLESDDSSRRQDDARKGFDRGHLAAQLQLSIARLLCAAEPEAFGRYRIGFQLWFAPNGEVRDVHLLESSGVKARDVLVLSVLHELAIDGLPQDLPQPVTILLTPRPDSAGDCAAYR